MTVNINQKVDGVNSALLDNQKQKDYEVIISKDFKHWEVKVKALYDYQNKDGLLRDFTLKLKFGNNLIDEPSKGVKEYLKIITDSRKKLILIHYYKDKDNRVCNWESLDCNILRVEGMWAREGFVISDDGEVIWWLRQAKEAERQCANCDRLLKIREKDICVSCKEEWMKFNELREIDCV